MKLNYEEVRDFKSYLENKEVSAMSANLIIKERKEVNDDKALIALCIIDAGLINNGRHPYFRMPKTKDLLVHEYDLDNMEIMDMDWTKILVQCH